MAPVQRGWGCHRPPRQPPKQSFPAVDWPTPRPRPSRRNPDRPPRNHHPARSTAPRSAPTNARWPPQPPAAPGRSSASRPRPRGVCRRQPPPQGPAASPHPARAVRGAPPWLRRLPCALAQRHLADARRAISSPSARSGLNRHTLRATAGRPPSTDVLGARGADGHASRSLGFVGCFEHHHVFELFHATAPLAPPRLAGHRTSLTAGLGLPPRATAAMLGRTSSFQSDPTGFPAPLARGGQHRATVRLRGPGRGVRASRWPPSPGRPRGPAAGVARHSTPSPTLAGIVPCTDSFEAK